MGKTTAKRLKLKISRIVFLLVAVVPTCIASTHRRSPTLIADIDLTSSPQFSANGDPNHAPPAIGFLSDTQLVLSVVDRNETPLSAATTGFSGPMHLLVDWFSITDSKLTLTRQDKLDSISVHDSVTTLPSGRVLINADQALSLYSPEHHLLLSKPVKDVCGPTFIQPDGSYYDSYLNIGSDDIALLNVLWDFPLQPAWADMKNRKFHPPTQKSSEGLNCWFNISNLSRIRTNRFPAMTGSISGTSFYSGTKWLTKSLEPDGWHAVSPPSDCKQGTPLDTRTPYLLRSGNGVATACADVLIVQGTGGRTVVKHGLGKRPPIIRTDSWKAPVIVLVSGKVRIGVMGLGSTFHESTRYVVLNYRTGDLAYIPELKTETHSGVFTGQISAIGLSPTGKYIAVLHGSHLTVYATNVVGQ